MIILRLLLLLTNLHLKLLSTQGTGADKLLSTQRVNPAPQTNCLSSISVNDKLIVDVIKELSCNSAAGPDGVPVALLKNASVELAKPLNILFNRSINMGHVPSTWKEAAIVPIYKGGDRSLAKNYRPISLTSTIMKVLERIIRKQLVDFLSDHNYFYPNQHGFRHGRSCLSALLDVYDNMMTSLSNNPKSSVDMIYLDYAKAFDKVDHGVLLNKLKNFGICGKLGEWLHSFLTLWNPRATTVDSPPFFRPDYGRPESTQ